jgi:NADH/NAD ratio-sensing transcriptional regulator Rex
MSDNLVNRLDRFYQVIKENGIDIPVIIVSRTPFAQDKFDELISNKNKTVKNNY